VRALAYALAWALGALAGSAVQLAFGDGLLTGAFVLYLAWTALGCAAAGLVWSAAPHVGAYPRRELLALVVIAGALVALGFLPETGLGGLLGWEWALLAVGGLTLCLRSLQSFLLHLGASAALLLVGLSFRPAGGPAVAFSVLALLLLATLHHEEVRERFPTGGAGLTPRPALGRALLRAVALVVLFAAFAASKPPARAVTAEDWLGWLRDAPEEPARFDDGPGLAPGASAGPADAASGVADLERGASVGFEKDLKFGDGPRAGALVALYVEPSWADGRPFDGDRFELFLATEALSVYDGRRWTAAPGEPEVLEADPGGAVELDVEAPGRRLRLRCLVAPLADRSLYAVYPVTRITLPAVERDPEGLLDRTAVYAGQFKYTATSIAEPEDLPWRLARARAGGAAPRHRDVPPSVARDPAFRRLARQVQRAGPADADRVDRALELLAPYAYDLRPELDPDADPTLAFLRARRGYCQHFASAAALLLRAADVPTRVVVGYAGGEWREDAGFYTVRRRAAHAWIEVAFEGLGWVRFDPVGRRSIAFDREPPAPEREPWLADPVPTPPEPEPAPGDDSSPPEPDRSPSPAFSPSPEESAIPQPTPSRRPSPSPSPTPDEPREVVRHTGTPRPTLPEPPPPETSPEFPAGAAGGRDVFATMWARTENAAGDASRGRSGGGEPAGGPGEETAAGAPAARRDRPAAPDLGALAGGGGGSVVGGSARFFVRALVRDLAVGLGIAALAILGLLVWRRRGPAAEPPPPPPPGDELELEGEVEAARRYAIPGSAESEVLDVYLRMLRALARRGLERTPAETPREFARRVADRAAEVGDLTALFVRARYGPDPLALGERETARRLLRAIEGL